jgi:hypothetical protein
MKALGRAKLIADAMKAGFARNNITATIIVRCSGENAMIGVSMTQPVTSEIQQYVADYFCDITGLYTQSFGFHCEITA